MGATRGRRRRPCRTLAPVRITVVELPDDERGFAGAWDQLAVHAVAQRSELVLLNEVPFAAWFGRTPRFDPDVWARAVAAHVTWQARLAELGGADVLLTAPTGTEHRRNTGVLWSQGRSIAQRDKALLPDEDPVWEAHWYGPGATPPEPFAVGGARAALVVCSELWAMQWITDLGRAGAQLIATPRATGDTTLDNWLAAGRVAALVAGAYSISSNRVGDGFGGGGWVFAPDGELLALTSRDEPFVTVDVDLGRADAAAATYPRYVLRNPPPGMRAGQ